MTTTLLASPPSLAKDAPARKGLPPSPPRTKEFQARVNAAVDRGIAWLRTRQRPDGGFFTKWGAGETALAVLTLRAGGATGEEEQVLRGLASLRLAYPTGKRFHDGNSNYGVAVTLLALEVHYNSGKPAESPIPDTDQAWIAWLTGYLVRSQTGTGGFGYGADMVDPASRVNVRQPGYWDNSNSQFTMLGLGAARLLGQDIPAEVWRKSLRHWIRTQATVGPTVPWYEPAGKEGTLYALGTAQARGWFYREDNTLSTGSMTAGGVSSVALCRDALAAELRADPVLDRASSLSLKDGLAWHGKHFTVQGNPMEVSIPSFGPPPMPPGPGPGRPPKGKPPAPPPEDPEDDGPASTFPMFHYYYLYGLERAGVLAGTAWVGRHDWYLEGAEYLMKAQHADGSWEDESDAMNAGAFQDMTRTPQVDTCFALLFLKRATTRLHTPTKARYGTPTAPVGEGLVPSMGRSLDEAAFADLFKVVFQRFGAADPEKRAVRAGDFVQMGTRSIPALLMRLADEDPAVRGIAIDALRLTTGETRGFDPAAPEDARTAALDAWEQWWMTRRARLVADVDAGRFREEP